MEAGVRSRIFRIAVTAICGVAALWTITACDVGAKQQAQHGSGPASTSASVEAAGSQTLTPTLWGPLSEADMKLMTIVRQTSIREITTSQWAMQRSSNAKVKQAAQTIVTQHVDLQGRDLDVAGKLGLKLPDQPSADMQVGIDRMRNETGTTFDEDYVNTLRQAHADALVLSAKVRANTQNSLVRTFAGVAHDYIQTHVEMLDATGDVDYSKLPVPQA